MINYVSHDDSYTIHESLKLRIYRSLFHKVIVLPRFTTSLPYPPSPGDPRFGVPTGGIILGIGFHLLLLQASAST